MAFFPWEWHKNTSVCVKTRHLPSLSLLHSLRKRTGRNTTVLSLVLICDGHSAFPPAAQRRAGVKPHDPTCWFLTDNVVTDERIKKKPRSLTPE